MIFTLLQSVSKQHFKSFEDFDNKRWLTPEPIVNNDNFIYIPFSAGPKNCIGQHMELIKTKIILSLTQYTCSTQMDSKIYISVQPSNYMRLSKIKENNND
ncbi:unnamed protein product [Paramecium pentaurelia]|uniref:Cytochrome P450 n=1 Tax=Paramecium pentaurelia TaxID=43138 RepID=A0A8S1XKX9_9CILI|nr:unnamed protein product [Paramecium pentaurelia]CAD8201478.1 unnamed protein product [Paramecium pentaurelia]